MDETTDTNNEAQLIILLRYTINFQIKEQFLSLVNISNDIPAVNIAKVTEKILEEYNIKYKLISQCYDGAPVMSGFKNGVNCLLNEKFHFAIYIHCFADKINLFIGNLIKNNEECNNFFILLDSIENIFALSSKRSNFLKKIITKKMTRVCKTRLNYNGII